MWFENYMQYDYKKSERKMSDVIVFRTFAEATSYAKDFAVSNRISVKVTRNGDVWEVANNSGANAFQTSTSQQSSDTNNYRLACRGIYMEYRRMLMDRVKADLEAEALKHRRNKKLQNQITAPTEEEVHEFISKHKKEFEIGQQIVKAEEDKKKRADLEKERKRNDREMAIQAREETVRQEIEKERLRKIRRQADPPSAWVNSTIKQNISDQTQGNEEISPTMVKAAQRMKTYLFAHGKRLKDEIDLDDLYLLYIDQRGKELAVMTASELELELKKSAEMLPNEQKAIRYFLSQKK